MNRYQNISKIKSSTGITYYRDNKYPIVPVSTNDIYIITTLGDRFDTLAQQYYGDSTLWWVISIANNNLQQNTLYLSGGIRLRIPIDLQSILNSYYTLNS